MLRVAVVGTSCSGKTTLARTIADGTGIKHIELDATYWEPDWTPMPIHKFREAVEAEVARDDWIIDGNYSKVRDIILARATHLVWLNLPFLTVFWRAISRTLKRVVTQEELFSGNRETLRLAFFHRDSIPCWVIRTYHRRIRQYRKLIDDNHYPHLKVFEVRNSADAKEVLLELAEAGCHLSGSSSPGARPCARPVGDG
jgi:adenylate kinase family enzyme